MIDKSKKKPTICHKNIIFKSSHHLDTIKKAVAKINKESQHGTTISVNRFITGKAYEEALRVLIGEI